MPLIPSPRIGRDTGNTAGLSLKSPRFLSNRWGPPQWVVPCTLPLLSVSLFLPRQESGNPGYEYPLVGLHRGIKVRYKSFIRLVMHSLRPIRRGLLVMVIFAAELAVEPPLSGVRPVNLCVSLASVGKPIGLPRRKNRCARAGGRASRRAGQISGIPTTISSHRSGRVRLRSVPVVL